MTTWGTDMSPGDAIDLTTFNVLWDATAERFAAHFGSPPSAIITPFEPPVKPVPDPADPDDPATPPLMLGSASLWGGGYSGPAGGYGWGGIQGSIATMIDDDWQSLPAYDSVLTRMWIDPTAAVAGVQHPTYWTMPTLRAACGLPITKCYYRDSNTGAVTEDTDRRNVFFQRSQERFINSLTAARDTQLNQAIAGQRARYSLTGKIYRCVSSGNWVRDPSQVPDMLSNTEDPPNALTDVPADPSARAYDYGLMRKDDVFRPHVFNESMRMLKLMRWQGRILTFINAFHRGGNIYDRIGRATALATTSKNSFADAVADYNARWGVPADTVEGTPAYQIYGHGVARSSTTRSVGGDGTQFYRIEGNRTKERWFVRGHPTIACSVDWYAQGMAGAVQGTTPNNPAPYSIKDFNGDLVGDAVLLKWGSTGPATGQQVISPYLGDLTNPPTPYDHTLSGASVVNGYQTPAQRDEPYPQDPACNWAIVKWDVAGGFAYT